MTMTTTMVVGTDELEAWYIGLGEEETNLVNRIVELLELKGIHLAEPYSRSLAPESTMGLRELRVQSVRHPIRIAYAFNPRREAVLLWGGDKKGRNEKRFLRDMVREAEAIWTQYLKEEFP